MIIRTARACALRLPAAVIALALTDSASAQSLKVTGLTQAGNQVTITIQNTGNSTGYRLEGSPSMASGTWNPVAGATFAPVAGQAGFFRTTVTRTVPGKLFYRVVGLTSVITAEDSDGDGLTNTFEAAQGTNPNLSDTDGDGFSDGQEFSYGTNPLLASSKPVLATKPAVQFADQVSTGTEGSPFTVQITLDKPYTGPVKYAVVPENSTATATGDFTAPGGTVNVSGTTATIPLTWNDDLILKTDRMLALDIVALGTDGYRTGGRSRHVIRLVENDAWWNGVCADTYAQRNFRLKLARNAAGLQVTFGSGPGNDGLPLLAGETAGNQSSLSEGIVPLGTFPGTVQFDTSAHFKITSPPMSVAASGITGPVTDMKRTIILESLPGAGSNDSIRPLQVIGRYTETLTSVTAPHLNRSFTGGFAIGRELPVPATDP